MMRLDTPASAMAWLGCIAAAVTVVACLAYVAGERRAQAWRDYATALGVQLSALRAREQARSLPAGQAALPASTLRLCPAALLPLTVDIEARQDLTAALVGDGSVPVLLPAEAATTSRHEPKHRAVGVL